MSPLLCWELSRVSERNLPLASLKIVKATPEDNLRERKFEAMERKSERKYKNLLSTTFWDSEESLNRSPNVLLGHGKTCYLSQGYWSQGYLLVQHPIVKVDHRGGIRTAKLLSRFKMAASMVSFCSMVEDNFRGVGLLYSLHTYFFFKWR